jgi:two-component system, response regulator YcbB
VVRLYQETTFFILDDDIACRRMLAKIIESEELGDVIDEKADGHNAEIAIIQSRADVVLIDMLMPGQSGLEVVENLRKRDYQGKFIMISQIESKDMVAQAYAAGVEFFIHKPINKIEVLSVIKRVVEQLRLRLSLDRVRESLSLIDGFATQTPVKQDRAKVRSKTLEILGDLGIIGEAGSKDLMHIVTFSVEVPGTEQGMSEVKHLKELYAKVIARNSGAEIGDVQAMEQRIRRAVKQAMENVAALGIEDYHDPKFERYAGKFFDFLEVRRKMRELESGEPGQIGPRINIRKFIEALISEVST